MTTKSSGVASIFRAARERSGLTSEDVAHHLGITPAAYDHVERIDEDSYMSLSLRQVVALCSLLGISPRDTMATGAASGAGTVEPSDLARAIDRAIRARGDDIEAFEEHVGWTVGPMLEMPERLWDLWNIDALIDVSNAAGLDWSLVLPA